MHFTNFIDTVFVVVRHHTVGGMSLYTDSNLLMLLMVCVWEEAHKGGILQYRASYRSHIYVLYAMAFTYIININGNKCSS